jgi:hypothetical protein
MISLSVYGEDGDPNFAAVFVTNNTDYNSDEYVPGLL